MKDTEILEHFDEPLNKCEADLISNINNLLNCEEHSDEYPFRDPFDFSDSKATTFHLETAPMVMKNPPAEEVPWSFDIQALREFNQELKELVLQGDPELSDDDTSPSPFMTQSILMVFPPEKDKGIQKLPGFFSGGNI